ncbi:uncharacterized protein G2W53_035568 [Senna tora]|uniref:Uncharacterized protein n=1 Tax=Senna tora TaxID=362788 RepID=A0A834SQP2_9FABA|nr:uncharacterized protein G2W53_035568 [Senna tora]
MCRRRKPRSCYKCYTVSLLAFRNKRGEIIEDDTDFVRDFMEREKRVCRRTSGPSSSSSSAPHPPIDPIPPPEASQPPQPRAVCSVKAAPSRPPYIIRRSNRPPLAEGSLESRIDSIEAQLDELHNLMRQCFQLVGFTPQPKPAVCRVKRPYILSRSIRPPLESDPSESRINTIEAQLVELHSQMWQCFQFVGFNPLPPAL